MNVKKADLSNKRFNSTLQPDVLLKYRKRSYAMLAIAFCLLAAIIGPQSANAQTPQQFLQPHVNFLKNQPLGQGLYWLNLVLVANWSNLPSFNPSGADIFQGAEYGTAQLTLNPSFTALHGTVKLYSASHKTSTGNPFDQNQTQVLNIEINTLTGQVTIGANSASLDTIVEPLCKNGVMAGFGVLGFVQKYYVLSLRDKFHTFSTGPS